MSRNVKKRHIIPLFIPHSGCPHRCAFCDQSVITGNMSTPPDEHALRKQIESFLAFKSKKRTQVQIAFYGGNFLGLPMQRVRRLLELAAEYVHSGDVDSIRFSTRPDTITIEQSAVLTDFPVRTVELGAQSMDDEVLTIAKRGHSAKDTEEAVSRLKKRKYEIGLQMMVGLPGENASSAMYSAKRMAHLHPDFVRIYPTLVLKGSRLAEWYQKGAYTPLSLEDAIWRTNQAYHVFKAQHISVIRLGLQASEALTSEKTLLAGPYHPAFGELVYSDIFYRKVVALLRKKQPPANRITLTVHPHSVSKIRGHRNQNIKKLEDAFGGILFKFNTDKTLPEDTVILG